MRDFGEDSRRQQELRGRPFADAVYREQFALASIKRFDGEDPDNVLMERVFAIDAELTLATGQVLSVQEKFLSNEFSRYNTVTVEHWQDPATGELGDWYKLRADLYLIAYFNPAGTDFEKWAILDVPVLKILTATGSIRWAEKSNANGRARATFRCVDVAKLPARCRLWSKGFVIAPQAT